jgi:hypothetical protein
MALFAANWTIATPAIASGRVSAQAGRRRHGATRVFDVVGCKVCMISEGSKGGASRELLRNVAARSHRTRTGA